MNIIKVFLVLLFVFVINGDYSSHALIGEASWYGHEPFLGNRTPSGIICDGRTPQIAHKTLPFGVIVKITNTSNGKYTVAIVTDRGPYPKGRQYMIRRIVDFNAKWQINRICDNKFKTCGLVKNIKLEIVDDTYACKAFRCLSKKKVAVGADGNIRPLGQRLESDEIKKLGLTWFK